MTKIYLAGGSFWGVQAYFDFLNGVTKTRVGYAQGDVVNPTYKEVCTGKTNHAETIEVQYEPKIISLENILTEYFSIIDPTSLNQQGNDKGTQYRTGIYTINDNDIAIVNGFISKMSKNYNKKIVVEVEKLKNFFDAEEYHQNYLKKNPNGYCHVDLSKFNKE